MTASCPPLVRSAPLPQDVLEHLPDDRVIDMILHGEIRAGRDFVSLPVNDPVVAGRPDGGKVTDVMTVRPHDVNGQDGLPHHVRTDGLDLE